MDNNLAKIPLVLNFNRIRRAYKGGKVLDFWQGIEPALDGNYPEEFLVSTIEVTNKNRYPGEGLSKVSINSEEEISLKEIIASSPSSFLGSNYAELCNGDLGVLARIGDPAIRLVIQAHPDKKSASEYLNYPFGKTEAWHILSCRDMENDKAHVYVGFKPGITKGKWKELFENQDIQEMLDSMHKIYVTPGQTILVEAGTPHAIGPGPLFLEIHEPSDYTLRMERNFLPDRTFTDEEIHYGMGIEKMFNCFHYDTYSYDEIIDKVIIKPTLLHQTGCAKEYSLISYHENIHFSVNKIEVNGIYSVPDFLGHRIAVITKGTCTFYFKGGSRLATQGHGVFLPAGIEDLKLKSEEGPLEVVMCFPPQIK